MWMVSIIFSMLNLLFLNVAWTDVVEIFIYIQWSLTLCRLSKIKKTKKKLFFGVLLNSFIIIFWSEEKKNHLLKLAELILFGFLTSGPWFRLSNISYSEILDCQLAATGLSGNLFKYLIITFSPQRVWFDDVCCNFNFDKSFYVLS